MKKLFLFGLMMVLLTTFVYGAACTNNPISGACTVAADLTLLNKTYNFTGENAINITGSNLVLDCSDATLVGDGTTGTYGIFTTTSARSNVLLKDCNIEYFQFGVYSRLDKNITIESFTITNSVSRGVTVSASATSNLTLIDSELINNTEEVYLERCQECNISFNNITTYGNGINFRQSSNNSIANDNDVRRLVKDSNGFGIYAESNAKGRIIFKNNYAENFYYNIRIGTGNNYSAIINSTSYNASLWGLSVESNFSNITGSQSFDSDWNCIYIQGTDILVRSNNVSNCKHNGIDAHHDSYLKYTDHAIIEYNNITKNSSDFDAMLSGISIKEASDTTIRYNRLVNIQNGTLWSQDTGMGINIENHNTSAFIYNNTFINVSGYCMRSTANYTKWQDNNLTNCDYAGIAFRLSYMPDDMELDTIFDNNTIDGNAFYRFPSVDMNITLNETSVEHYINITPEGFINFSYDGYKDISIYNNSLYIRGALNYVKYNISSDENWMINEYANTLPDFSTSPTSTLTITDGRYYVPSQYELKIKTGIYDCNDATFIASSTLTGALFLTYQDDHTSILNCNLDGNNVSTSALYINGGGWFNLTNTNLSGGTTYGLYMRGVFNSTFADSFIGERSREGIVMDDDTLNGSSSNYFFNLTIDSRRRQGNDDGDTDCSDGIRIISGSHNIFHNITFKDWCHDSFEILGTNSTFRSLNNTLKNSLIYDEYSTYNRGLGIDGYKNMASNNSFFNIRIENTTVRNQINGNNNRVWNITILNTINSLNYPTSPRGQAFDFDAYSTNYTSENNTLINITIDGTESYAIRISTNVSGLILRNFRLLNIYNETDIFFADPTADTRDINIRLDNFTTNDYILSLKSASTVSKIVSFNLTNMEEINSIFNSSSATPLYENVDNDFVFNTTIAPGNRVFVFTYPRSNDPAFTNIATGITDIEYSYEPNDKIVTANYTGTGNFILNTTRIRNNRGYFGVQFNLGSTTLFNVTLYTSSGNGDYRFFYTTDTTSYDKCIYIVDKFVGSFISIAAWVSLVILVAIGGGIIFFINRFQSGEGFDLSSIGLPILIIGTVALSIVITVVILIMNNIRGSLC